MVTLHNGDCLDYLKEVVSSSVDLVVTSPPYDNLRTYNGNIEQWNFDKFKLIAIELYRVMKDGGVVVWIVDDATVDGSETCSSFKQALFFRELGFNLHDTMIWEKPTFTATGSLKVRYAPVFEYMFVLSKGKPKTFNPIKDKENKRSGVVRYVTVRNDDGTTTKLPTAHQINEFGQRHNVWQIPACISNNERCGHPAPFPVRLAQDHIISWSNEGDIVLDPFMGSGSTGVACINTNRKFIGIELDAKYFNIAKDRLNKAEEDSKIQKEVLF